LIDFEKVKQRAEIDAKTHGYYLNPNTNFLKDLLEGLQKNEELYKYPSCPCRLASGKFELDRDIVCPCDYRDPDVLEFGACYCSLYVSRDIFEGRKETLPIPERRPKEKQDRAYIISADAVNITSNKSSETSWVGKETFTVKSKLWYCRQCGYVTFREEPPYVCPICKAKREMFSELKIHVGTYE
jgi:ferredoxin-thioredoxin reductase catalytic subunit/rubredoxin